MQLLADGGVIGRDWKAGCGVAVTPLLDAWHMSRQRLPRGCSGCWGRRRRLLKPDSLFGAGSCEMRSVVPASPAIDAFLLLKQWRDTSQGLQLDLWATSDAGPLHITISGHEAVMFVERTVEAKAARRRPVELCTLAGDAVDALYFTSQRALVSERERLRALGIRPSEADIKPVERYLMERFITGGITIEGVPASRGHFINPKVSASDYQPRLSLLSLDIETDGFEGPLLSIAGASAAQSRVFVVGGAPDAPYPEHISFWADERAALLAFLDWVQLLDPDLLVGWNVVDFDLRYLGRLAARLRVPFALGRERRRAQVLDGETTSTPAVARVPGRVVLDGIATLRSATLHFESFALEDVAQALLSRGKEIQAGGDTQPGGDKVEEIRRMWREDPVALARYNLVDCQLVLDIFKQARLVEFAVERARLTGLSMDRQGGSVAAFDQLYLPRLHRAGFVAPSVGDSDAEYGSPGGFVMNSVPGLFNNVIVLDFKSLYPSIIRTFLVDPLGLSQPGNDPVEGFDGGTFAREGHILPELIRALWQARDGAKSDKNAALSQAIKIMMNSFYGVLGTPGCRFFDQRLVSSITKRGHQILGDARRYIEGRGLRVIYGDTDSLFVHLGDGVSPADCEKEGRRLAHDLTEHFRADLQRRLRIESQLELEYETHFHRFVMPTIRGSDVGTKKRYAGSVVTTDGKVEIIFKGLEAVRTDWTPLARQFQRELFRRVLCGVPHRDFIIQTARDLLSGKLDAELVYKKRLRRPLSDYIKNVPPHVQAARKLDRVGRSVEYLITKSGPEPARLLTSPIDYDHYLNRQLAPAAESILYFLGEDFRTIAGPQLQLFGDGPG